MGIAMLLLYLYTSALLHTHTMINTAATSEATIYAPVAEPLGGDVVVVGTTTMSFDDNTTLIAFTITTYF